MHKRKFLHCITEAHDENDRKMLEIKDFMLGANKTQLLLWTNNNLAIFPHMSNSVRSVLDAFNGFGLMTIVGYPNVMLEDNKPMAAMCVLAPAMSELMAEKIFVANLLSVPMDARSRIFNIVVDLVKMYDKDDGLSYLHELILWHPQAIRNLTCFFPPCICTQIASFLNWQHGIFFPLFLLIIKKIALVVKHFFFSKQSTLLPKKKDQTRRTVDLYLF